MLENWYTVMARPVHHCTRPLSIHRLRPHCAAAGGGSFSMASTSTRTSFRTDRAALFAAFVTLVLSASDVSA